MANVNIQDLVKSAIEAITPTLAEALAKALADNINPNANDNPNPNANDKKKGGFRKSKHIDSTFVTTEGEINVCEYSDKSIAIWGDTKDKTYLIAYLKEWGQHDKHKANFVTPLSAIESRPVGWTLNKEAITANGGIDDFIEGIEMLGFKVLHQPSVKDVFEANKAARANKDANPNPNPNDNANANDSKKGKGKKDKPSIAPTDEQKASKVDAPATAPTAAPKVVALTIKGMCYDNTKEGTHNVVERELIKRGDYYIAQGSKGARIYAKIGTHVIEGHDLYACIAIVKGDVTKNDCEQATAWTAWSKDILGSVKSGALKASNAIMYAYVDAGDQSAVDAIWAKMQAA